MTKVMDESKRIRKAIGFVWWICGYYARVCMAMGQALTTLIPIG